MNITDEGDFRRYVIDQCRSNAHVSYIESHQTSAGIPDLNVFVYGRDVWIELKVFSDNKSPKMRTTQKKWHIDRFFRGGLSWVMAYDLDQKLLVVIPGNTAATLSAKAGVWRGSGILHPLDGIGGVIHSMSKRIRQNG